MPEFPLVTETERRFSVGFTKLLCERDLDARRGPVRRVRELFRALSREVAPDDNLTIAQRLLLQRTAVLASLCSHLEASMLLGQSELPVGDYIAMTATMRRLLTTVTDQRLKRQMKDISPSLADIVREHEAAAAEAAP
jgi:hypothetical protein